MIAELGDVFVIGDGTYFSRVVLVTLGDNEALWCLLRLTGETEWTGRLRIRDIATRKLVGDSFEAKIPAAIEPDSEAELTTKAIVEVLTELSPAPTAVKAAVVCTICIDSADENVIVEKLQPFLRFPRMSKGGSA